MRESLPSRECDADAHAVRAKRRIDSKTLLGDENELIISHGQDEYRLRLTRQGKLILTK